MLYGLIGGQTGGISGGDIALPAGAVGIADFVNGGYKWGATGLAALDVVDRPATITPNVGLVATDDDIVVPKLIGDFATYLMAGDWTAVLYWDKSGSSCSPLHIQDEADDNPRFVLQDGAFWWLAYDVSGGAGTERDNEDDFTHGTSSVAAITRTDAKIVSSFNGRATVANTASSSGFASGVNGAFLCGNSSGSGGAMTLKKLVIYPAQADADLPGLST